MSLQNTLRNKIRLVGIELYGGNLVETILKPAEEDIGIIFHTTSGDIKAKLDYASQYRSSILLDNGRTQVISVEHILATLYAYGVDNAIIELNRIPSKSYKFLKQIGLATKVEVLPVFVEREKTLCDKLDEVGLEQQRKERRLLSIKRSDYKDGLWFEPINNGLVIIAETNYPVIGKESKEVAITSKMYRNELSKSRPYAKHVPLWIPLNLADIIAAVANPTFGIGHGFNSLNVFLPVKTKEEWREQEFYPAEIARHTIVDRLGALALLDGRLEGVKVTARYSGHARDIRILREKVKEGFFIQQH